MAKVANGFSSSLNISELGMASNRLDDGIYEPLKKQGTGSGSGSVTETCPKLVEASIFESCFWVDGCNWLSFESRGLWGLLGEKHL